MNDATPPGFGPGSGDRRWRPGGSTQEAQEARRRIAEERARAERRAKYGCGCLIFAVILAVLGGGLYACSAYYGSTREVTVHINRIGQSADGKTPLVYTSDGVFEDTDTIGKTNSSDIINELCPGGVYKLKVRGFRNSVMSMWPNILKVEAVVTPPPAFSLCTNDDR